MFEIYFLIGIGIIWLVWASCQDLKFREVNNWIGFSLILFALGFRFFYSLFVESVNWNFFYSGLIGLGIFFILGNLFYYGRVFAGGDAKLMIALGPVLGIGESFILNLKIYGLFLILFLFVGAFYGLFWSFLAGKNWKSFILDFKNRIRKRIWLGIFSLVFAIIFVGFGIFLDIYPLVYIGVLMFLFYYLVIFAKSIDEVCMVKKISLKNLTIGDWLYEDVRFGKRKIDAIKSGWEGLSEEEINLLRTKFKNKNKKILIRQGIPYIPVFLISYALLIYGWFFVRELMLGLF